MTAPTPPTAHEEIDFLDEIEKALLVLTTAQMEDAKMPPAVPGTAALPFPDNQDAVISADAGTLAGCDVPTDNTGAAAQPGWRLPPARG